MLQKSYRKYPFKMACEYAPRYPPPWVTQGYLKGASGIHVINIFSYIFTDVEEKQATKLLKVSLIFASKVDPFRVE